MVKSNDTVYSPDVPRRGRPGMLWVAAALILIPGGYGFVEKFIQFARTLALGPDEGGFTIIPIMNYLVVTAGMVCLLMWAVMHGMFRDIEKPKYTMLEREAQLDLRDTAEEGEGS